MDSFKINDAKAEKVNAISRQRRIRRITTLFRFLEIFIFLFVISRFSTQFAFSLKPSAAYFKRVSVALISPRFVFLAGNMIVAVLFLISGRFSPEVGTRGLDFYDEYLTRSQSNRREIMGEEEGEKAGACRYGVFVDGGRKMSRCRSENLGRAAGREEEGRQELPLSVSEKFWKSSGDGGMRLAGHGEERRRELRRSVNGRFRKSNGDCGRRLAGGGFSYVENEMSNEEFRRTVEEFIARQQRILREEEEGFSAVVSV